jgi:hypothetical protein
VNVKDKLRIALTNDDFTQFLKDKFLGRLYYALWWADHERPSDLSREQSLFFEAEVFMMFFEEYEKRKKAQSTV